MLTLYRKAASDKFSLLGRGKVLGGKDCCCAHQNTNPGCCCDIIIPNPLYLTITSSGCCLGCNPVTDLEITRFDYESRCTSPYGAFFGYGAGTGNQYGSAILFQPFDYCAYDTFNFGCFQNKLEVNLSKWILPGTPFSPAVKYCGGVIPLISCSPFLAEGDIECGCFYAFDSGNFSAGVWLGCDDGTSVLNVDRGSTTIHIKINE